jgi:hypothetical protein
VAETRIAFTKIVNRKEPRIKFVASKPTKTSADNRSANTQDSKGSALIEFITLTPATLSCEKDRLCRIASTISPITGRKTRKSSVNQEPDNIA